MITINNVQYRNLQEQVEKNKKDILFILEEEGTLSEFGLKLVGQANYEGDLPNPLGYLEAGGQYGDAYAVGRETPYTLFVFTRANGTHPNDYWFNIGKFPLAGPAGADGAKGDKGDTGLTGERGPEGKVGPMGPQGPAGPRGIQGPQGNQGIRGPQGVNGESFMVVGLLPTTEQLPAPTELIRNEAYLVGADNDYDMYIIIGKPGEQLLWFNAGKVEGVKGDKGDVGPQGIQGPQGATGLQGNPGPRGEAGPVGPTGPQGIQGLTGPQGVPGKDGVVDLSNLQTVLVGSDTIVVDLAPTGDKLVVKVDEDFKNTLATKTELDTKANYNTKKLELSFLDGLTTKDEYFKKIKNLLITNKDTSLVLYGTPVELQPFWDVWTKPVDFKATHVYLVITLISNVSSNVAFDFRLYPSNYSDCYFTTVHGLYDGYVGDVGWIRLNNLNSKLVNAVNETEKVYATDGLGDQTTLQYNVEPYGDGLVRRTSDGRVKAADPTEENDATSKKYVDNLVGQLGSFHIETASKLPTTGKENTLYFIGPDGDGNYDEYMYVLNKWELLGTTKIDLSGYATTTITDGLRADIDNNTALLADKQDKLTETQLDAINVKVPNHSKAIATLKTDKQDKLTDEQLTNLDQVPFNTGNIQDLITTVNNIIIDKQDKLGNGYGVYIAPTSGLETKPAPSLTVLTTNQINSEELIDGADITNKFHALDEGVWLQNYIKVELNLGMRRNELLTRTGLKHIGLAPLGNDVFIFENDKYQVEITADGLAAQQTIGRVILHVKPEKQNKLAQKDLDNIAMINQYGESIATNTSKISTLETNTSQNSSAITSLNENYTSLNNNKQNKLIAGEGISIVGDTISSTGGAGGKLYQHCIIFSNEAGNNEFVGTSIITASNVPMTYLDVCTWLNNNKFDVNNSLMLYPATGGYDNTGIVGIRANGPSLIYAITSKWQNDTNFTKVLHDNILEL